MDVDKNGYTSDTSSINLTARAARAILFTALDKANAAVTGDKVLHEARRVAAATALDTVDSTASSSIRAISPLIDPGGPDLLRRHGPKALSNTARTVAEVYKTILHGVTNSLETEDAQPAKRQVARLAAHVSTVISVATNLDSIQEQMPTVSQA